MDNIGGVTPELQIQIIKNHCIKTRDRFSYESNRPHHERWNAMLGFIDRGEYEPAIQYALPFAKKGWVPWQEVSDKLEYLVRLEVHRQTQKDTPDDPPAEILKSEASPPEFELKENELLKRVRAIIDPKMAAMGLKYDARASDILRRCILREYEKGHWKMDKPGAPFYATAWFNRATNYNEPPEFVTPAGMAERIDTFKHRMLPTEWDIDRRYTDNIKDRYAVAAYPNCSVFTLNGEKHIRHTYGMVYFCSSNPPDDMDWQPDGREFPQSGNRKITIDR